MRKHGFKVGITITYVLRVGLVYQFLKLFHIGFAAVAAIIEVQAVALGEAVFEMKIRCPVFQALLDKSFVHALS